MDVARPGGAWQGMALRGAAMSGAAMLGVARQGKDLITEKINCPAFLTQP